MRLPEAAARRSTTTSAMYINTARPDPTVTGDHVAATRSRRPRTTTRARTSRRLVQRGSLDAHDRVRPDGRRDRARSSRSTRSASTSSTTPSCCRCTSSRTSPPGGPTRSVARSTRTPPTTRAPSRTSTSGSPQGGDQIIIGAEQWPECINPITECANSSWYVWTDGRSRSLPSVWDTTADGTTRPPPLVTGEPDVELGLIPGQ